MEKGYTSKDEQRRRKLAGDDDDHVDDEGEREGIHLKCLAFVFVCGGVEE